MDHYHQPKLLLRFGAEVCWRFRFRESSQAQPQAVPLEMCIEPGRLEESRHPHIAELHFALMTVERHPPRYHGLTVRMQFVECPVHAP